MAQAGKLYFEDLSYKSFVYPGDEEALENLKKIPGARRLFRWLIENALEDYLQLENKYYRTLVTAENYPSVHERVQHCCKVLDCPAPETYLGYSPFFNAMTFGVNRTFLVIKSAMVETYTDDELDFVIGHELGHIKAGHVLYKTIAWFIVQNLQYLQLIVPFPLPIGVLIQPLLLAMFEWSLRAEFTADRAGLLTVQDAGVAMQALSRFSGRLNKLEHEHNLDSMLQQVQDIEKYDNQMAKIMLFINSMGATHPYPVLRLQKLKDWMEEGGYRKVISGEYVRDDEGEHELGPRLYCDSCRIRVNAKRGKCPRCGTQLVVGRKHAWSNGNGNGNGAAVDDDDSYETNED